MLGFRDLNTMLKKSQRKAEEISMLGCRDLSAVP
jgi:hypothetical protein